MLLLSEARCAGSLLSRQSWFSEMFVWRCAVVNISEVADHQQHTLQLTSAAQGVQCFAYRDTCSAHIFGFVVVDVNYNAGFVIPISE